MGETRRKFDQDFREGAVRLVRETGKPIAQVARELGIVPGTLENWVAKDRRQREGGDGRLSEDERAELVRLRRENAELAMRCGHCGPLRGCATVAPGYRWRFPDLIGGCGVAAASIVWARAVRVGRGGA
jgi:transposase